jgi:trehalose 6-phosphate synthase
VKREPIVVSNRLPINVCRHDEQWQIQPASGGLVSALEPLMKECHGTWIGWPGCSDEAPLQTLAEDFSSAQGYKIKPVPLTEQEVAGYYAGFSNETIWPLFHDLLGKCKFVLADYRVYESVNRKFAEFIAETGRDDRLVWIHDYQLMLCGSYLRELQPTRPLAFFLHIPFPSPDLFRRLPWAGRILRGLLDYDVVGFQTWRDQRNFVQCATAFLEPVRVTKRRRRYTVLDCGGWHVKVCTAPISIDFAHFSESVAAPEVAEAAVDLYVSYGQRKLILGIDRLDYTKGIPERFLAFERALEKYPELQQNCSLLQVVVPSRTTVPDYIELRAHLEQLAGNINGRFSEHDWVPLHYHFRSLESVELLAHYRAADIALITPLRDGMNLVAKEFCACKRDNWGTLILSKFAGAADELGRDALVVNPYDVEQTADTIYAAFSMADEETQRRMSRLRRQIGRNDVQRWLHTFLGHLQSAREGADG